MPPLAVSLGYILLIALWGSTWAAIKVGIDAVPPFVFAFERAVAVSVILVGLSLAMRLPFPRDRRVIVAAVVVGIINIGTSWAIIFWSEQYVPSGLVSVFGASSPIWTALLAHFLVRGDRLSATKVIGLVLGMAGMGVLVGAPDTSGRPEVLVASALLALMPITWAVGTILQARALRHGSPLPLVAIGACAGSLFLLPFAAAQSGDAGDWSINVALAFGYLVATDHDDAFAGRDPRAGSSYRRARAGRAHHLAHGRGRGAGGGCVSPQRSRRRGCSGGTSPGRVSRRLGRLARHSISGKSAFTSKRDGTIVGLTGPATNSPVGSGGPTHVVPSFDPRDRCCTWSRVLDQHRSWHRQRVQPDRQWRALLGT